MEKIKHSTIFVNGINMHVAEIGDGPPVLFLHGFPDLWYTWRHQMLSLSSRGYRAIAPDMRGYGDTDAPPSAASYTAFHIVGDIVGLLDALGLDRVFLVGHDWGASMAWYLCLFRPDREPGEAEEEFSRVDTARLIKYFFLSRTPGPLCVPKEVGFGGSPHTPLDLPSWLSEEDLNYYVTKFTQKGFTGGLNYYRALDL
ncbi:hypothetical protein RHMOL_Rhmol01G0379900 [Rhododendron molle]|uniref:Uncharacterized protein n=1 Tax=Rhododendron molle TaxID=49168 RepID=A0ACC0QC16_RHOML|nr:hypothetical protein RHMOL_Rhmol01G0379900 [Rhododendron molle]